MAVAEKREADQGGATPAERAVQVLQDLVAQANGPLALASSFSIEDTVIIDLICRNKLPISVFAIDTGRLPEETFQAAERVQMQYGISIDWYTPDHNAVAELLKQKGSFSFRDSVENRKECCYIRKVEPLGRALAGLGGWVTGMRREQSPTRGEVHPVEIDAVNGGILKGNPLYDWSAEDVEAYATQYAVPRHPLHKLGYPSIGCAPCTRAIEPGESFRAGRWWWEDPEHKECGLHRR